MTESVKRTGLLWHVLCVTTWTLTYKITPGRGSSVSHAYLSSCVTSGLDSVGVTVTTSTNNTDVVCLLPLPPQWGSFSVVEGTRESEGTTLVFCCQEDFQLVGREKISCVLQGGAPHWSSNPPVCEDIPRPEKRGLHLAVVASIVSSIIIIAMAISFIVCCLQECVREENGEQRERRRSSQETLLNAPLTGLLSAEGQV